jgi:hypothetical protein
MILNLVLIKLNYWYDQYGGGKECDEYTDEKNVIKKVIKIKKNVLGNY